MKKFLLSNSKIVIGIAIAVIAVVIAAVAVHMTGGVREDTSYRSVQIYDIQDGDAEVERESLGAVAAYENMMLQNKDILSTFEKCYLQLQMDGDKYVLVEPETTLTLEPLGNATDSETTLELEQGGIVNQLDHKLSDKSYYRVNTPNSTMAVRGTTFRVQTYYDENGTSHTYLTVFDGKVECQLIFPDGSVDDEIVVVLAGQRIGIWGNDKESAYEFLDGVAEYPPLDTPILEFLGFCIDHGADIDMTRDELEQIIEIKSSTYMVTFLVNSGQFGTQTVAGYDYATEPKLKPSQNGHWDYDFTQAITGDTTISWVEE